jgi:dolichol-phosphate mannosyltransferase
MPKKISIVVPVYNETDNISAMVQAVADAMQGLPYDFDLTFVDDGSKDATLAIIKDQSRQHAFVQYISFSRNFGHQNALKAGFDHCNGDAIITMDGDLQHPPALIPELLKAWEAGAEIVYTLRKDHLEMSRMKKGTSNLFYNVLNSLSDIELEKGTADFRLMDKRVIDVVRDIKEYDLFWRGLVKWLGFKQVAIEYTAAERLSGKSKYTMRKMMEFALKGITSFSTKPLNFAIYLGFGSALLALLYIPYILYSLYFGHPVSGWASMIATIVFFGGLQLIILGIIGMYLGKLFMQSKQRPHYIIKEKTV